MAIIDFTITAYDLPIQLGTGPCMELSFEDYPVSADVSVEGGEIVVNSCFLRHEKRCEELSEHGPQGVIFDLIAETVMTDYADEAFEACGERPFNPSREYGTLDARAL
jgi:hypothetical protein